MTIDGYGGIGLVTLQHEIDSLARRLQRRVAERVFLEHRRKARGDQQRIAFAQRHVEQLGEMQQHLAAGLRAAGFQKAQVLRGNLRLHGEVELAHAPPLAPFAQQVADRTRRTHLNAHGSDDSAAAAGISITCQVIDCPPPRRPSWPPLTTVNEDFVMNSIRASSLLRRVLVVDAVTSGAMGLAMIAFAELLANLLQLPVELITEAGIVLLPFAAFVGFVASRSEPARFLVWTIIALNVVWVVDSIVLLFTGWV